MVQQKQSITAIKDLRTASISLKGVIAEYLQASESIPPKEMSVRQAKCLEAIESFIKMLDLLPYRWAGHDKSDHDVGWDIEDNDFLICFYESFEEIAGAAGVANYASVPLELYNALQAFKEYDSRSYNDISDKIVATSTLLESIILSITPFLAQVMNSHIGEQTSVAQASPTKMPDNTVALLKEVLSKATWMCYQAELFWTNYGADVIPDPSAYKVYEAIGTKAKPMDPHESMEPYVLIDYLVPIEQLLRYLPYYWTKIDPVTWTVNTESVENRYFYAFCRLTSEATSAREKKMYEIPEELFGIHEDSVRLTSILRRLESEDHVRVAFDCARYAEHSGERLTVRISSLLRKIEVGSIMSQNLSSAVPVEPIMTTTHENTSTIPADMNAGKSDCKSDQLGYAKCIYELLVLYRLYGRIVQVYMNGPLRIITEQLQRHYIRVCQAIDLILGAPGFDILRSHDWRVEEFLGEEPLLDNDDVKKQILGFTAAIISIHIRHGEQTFSLEEELQDAIDKISNYLDEYLTDKKEHEQEWLKRMERLGKEYQDRENRATPTSPPDNRLSKIASGQSGLPRLTNNDQTIECVIGIFDFTRAQAPILRVFWDNYMEGNVFMDEYAALERADRPKTERLTDAFKSRLAQFRQIFEQHRQEKNLYRLKLD